MIYGRLVLNRSWRFYFKIQGDEYAIIGIVPHPK
jgi:hypothetical protein